MLLLQSVLALALVVAGFGVFLLLRWADRLEVAVSARTAASVHAFPIRGSARREPGSRAAA
ncbi:MAG: hypothetical protein NDJ94_10835 [Vicinamibacteria bacterium]|nr:hypothetical protein [Vicinamibacteria bacterium]